MDGVKIENCTFRLSETEDRLLRLGQIETATLFQRYFVFLQELEHDIALSKGWWNPPKSFGEQIVMMHSELSEVIEAYRTEDGDITKVWFDENGKPEGVPIEFADLVIRVLDTCGRYNIDLLGAILSKTKYNMSRSQRHGNKKI